MGTLVNRILWIVTVVSLLIYAVVAKVVAAQVGSAGFDGLSQLRVILAILAIAIAAGSIHFRRRFLVSPIQTGQLRLDAAEDQQRAFQAFVIGLALSESVGILGLVLAFLAGDAAQYYPFMLGALVLMVLHRPTASELNPNPAGGGWRGPTRPE